MHTDPRTVRIADMATLALEYERVYGLPARLMLAQWACESAWGAEPVGGNGPDGGNNYFGMKRAKRHQRWVKRRTREHWTPEKIAEWDKEHPGDPARIIRDLPNGRKEVEILDEFAAYDDLKASCDDYCWLITHGDPYRKAWAAYLMKASTEDLIRDVVTIYASSQYAETALKISRQRNVVSAIDAARKARVA